MISYTTYHNYVGTNISSEQKTKAYDINKVQMTAHVPAFLIVQIIVRCQHSPLFVGLLLQPSLAAATPVSCVTKPKLHYGFNFSRGDILQALVTPYSTYNINS